MRVRYLASASVVVEHRGTSVLCDPWLTDGIYYGSWHHYPRPDVEPDDLRPDYVYVSHIHPDHLDVRTLEALPRTTPILILDFAEKFVHRVVSSLGFEDVREIGHGETVQLAEDFTLELAAADDCDPALCGRWFGCAVPSPYGKTLQIDSIGVFHGGGRTVVNVNDSPFALARAVSRRIVEKYGRPDLVLLGYSGAGPYPQCFDMPPEEKLEAADAKRRQFLGMAVEYLRLLQPEWFMPFAGQYTLGGRLAPLNRFRGVPELEELEDALAPLLAEAGLDSRPVLLNSGEHFDVDEGAASAPFMPPEPSERRRYVETVLAARTFPYEDELRIDPADWTDLTPRLEEARARMLRYQDRYGGFRSNWAVYLDAGQDVLYRVPFDGSTVTRARPGGEEPPFVRVGVDYSLLDMILSRRAHWNNATIGSHLRFAREPDSYERGVHHFMAYLHC